MDAALAVRRRLAGVAGARAQRALERGFDEACPGQEVVRVGRLDLTVRVDASDTDLDRLGEAVFLRVSEALEPVVGRMGKAPAGPVSRSTTREGARYDVLLHYLESGSLPWEVAEAERAALLGALQETAAGRLGDVLESVYRSLASGPARRAFLFRLLQLMPVDGWVAVARAAAAAADREWIEPLAGAITAVAAAAADRYARIDLAARLIAAAAEPPDFRVLYREELMSAAASAGVSTPLRAVIALLCAAAGAGPARPSSAPAGGPLPAAAKAHAGRTAAIVASTTPAAGVPTRPSGLDRAADLEEAAECGWPARHAGLVLLHPFLPAFFARTAITSTDGTSLPEERRPRAAALLHYLSTGDDEAFEFDLGLIKILVGARPEAPLAVSSGLLSPEDRAEAEELLRAALGHWSVLKGTSVGALRSSFLGRRGFLREEPACWRLLVPSEPFDHLLKFLPWGIGIARLPWLTRHIETEWQTP